MKGFARFLIFFILIVGLSYFAVRSCSGSQNVVNSNKGSEFIQDSSRIVIPIQIDITSFEPIFNHQMEEPEWFYESENVEVNKQVSLSYRVKKDGQAQLYPQDDAIQLQIPLLIDIHPKITGPLGIGIAKKMRLETLVVLNSAITVDLNEDWALDARAESSFEIKQSPVLNVAGFKINFESQLLENLQAGIGEINEMIEGQIKEALDTREIVKVVWDGLKTPYEIENEEFTAWAMIQPIDVRASDLKAAGPGVIETVFEVSALIDIETGNRPIRINSKKLPPAVRVQDIAEAYSQFHVPLFLPFSSLSDMINNAEEGLLTVDLGVQKAIFKDVELSNKKNQLCITADFVSGAAMGEIELYCMPKFNQQKQLISVEFNQIKSKSNNKVVDQLLEGLANNSVARKQISERLQYNVKEDLAKLSIQISEQMKATSFNEYAHLDGFVNSLLVKDIHLAEDKIILDTFLEAATVCVVQPKQGGN